MLNNMSLMKKYELEVELKSPPDAFWKTVKDINVIYPKLFPDTYQSIEILEGDGKSAGSIRFVTYATGKFSISFKGDITAKNSTFIFVIIY